MFVVAVQNHRRNLPQSVSQVRKDNPKYDAI